MTKDDLNELETGLDSFSDAVEELATEVGKLQRALGFMQSIINKEYNKLVNREKCDEQS